MKTKLFAVAALTLLIFAIMPVFSFEPEEPSCVLYISPQDLKIQGPCCESQTFPASVNVYEVIDLWAWEICIYWDARYINITEWTLNFPWTDPTDYEVLLEELITTWTPSYITILHFIVTGKGDAANFTGSMSLVDMTFHVEYEPCWPDCLETEIKFCTDPAAGWNKLSTGCGNPICCELHEGKVSLNPSKPNIEVFFTDVWPGPPLSATWNESKVAQGWFEDQVITAYVWISNITKLYDIEFILNWNTSLIHVDLQQITINEEAFPMPWSTLIQRVYEQEEEPYWDAFAFYIERDHSKPPVKGTFWIVKLEFKVNCVTTCDDFPIPADGPIAIYHACLSTCCDDGDYCAGPCGSDMLDVSHAKYFWTPIPYDFDQSGHVGVEDIMWIMDYYGMADTSYDLNDNGVVDIYDVVIVAKHYCDSTPPDMPEDP